MYRGPDLLFSAEYQAHRGRPGPNLRGCLGRHQFGLPGHLADAVVGFKRHEVGVAQPDKSESFGHSLANLV